MYMIAPSSSSRSDQLALIGEEVFDQMRFFCGDKPAQQFERGTQIGGKYKCGGCGCKDHLMQDLPHAFHCKTRSLSDLQKIVISGKHGKKAGELKPLDSNRSY